MATIRHMQSAQNAASGVTTRTVTIAPNGRNTMLVVLVGVADPLASLTVTDTASHTWNQVSNLASATDFVSCQYAFSTTSSPITITSTTSGGPQFMNILLDEFSGVDVNDSISDVQQVAGTAPIIMALTPDRDGSVIWAGCNDTVTSVGSGYTKGADDGSGDWSEWKAVPGGNIGVAQTVSFGGSGNYQLVGLMLNPAPSPQRFNRLRPYIFGPGNAR